MPKVIVKSRYMTDNHHMAQYLRYIATREGVELLPPSVKARSATYRQRQFIESHLSAIKGLRDYAKYAASPTIENASKVITEYAQGNVDIGNEYKELARKEAVVKDENAPVTKNQVKFITSHLTDAKGMLEYEDYEKKPTFGNASALITAIAELHITDPVIYLRYIAERPGVAKKEGEVHGLWNLNGRADLKNEIQNVEKIEGVAWTHIISLRREDAKRLNFENADAWRGMIAVKARKIAGIYNMDMKHMHILGAFHNESHHPHIHLFVYSDKADEGLVMKKRMESAGEKMRSMFTNYIFAKDIAPVTERKTQVRNEMRERVKQICNRLYNKTYSPNPELVKSMRELSAMVPMRGRLQYAYMTPDIKTKINDTLRLAVRNDETLEKLTNEYFKCERKLIENYNDDPEKVEVRYSDAVNRFYEPRAGKYVKGNDVTTLHNIILRSAYSLKKDIVFQTPKGEHKKEKPEVLPVISEPEIHADKKAVIDKGGIEAGYAAAGAYNNTKVKTSNQAVKYTVIGMLRRMAWELSNMCEVNEKHRKAYEKKANVKHRGRFRAQRKNFSMQEDLKNER